MIILIMGVSGSGKTTVGRRLAATLGWRFADADDFHPPANIAKMAAGEPLDDADRGPWLAALRTFIDGCLARDENAVLACSALKSRYRDELTAGREQIKLAHLHGSRDLLLARLANRAGHYMKAGMLDSQLALLEPPPHAALVLDISRSPSDLVAEIRRSFRI